MRSFSERREPPSPRVEDQQQQRRRAPTDGAGEGASEKREQLRPACSERWKRPGVSDIQQQEAESGELRDANSRGARLAAAAAAAAQPDAPADDGAARAIDHVGERGDDESRRARGQRSKQLQSVKSSSDLGASQTLDRSRERPRYSENTVSKSREFGSSDEESKGAAVESPSEPIERRMNAPSKSCADTGHKAVTDHVTVEAGSYKAPPPRPLHDP